MMRLPVYGISFSSQKAHDLFAKMILIPTCGRTYPSVPERSSDHQQHTQREDELRRHR
jgi:hypothetical protein